MAAAATRSSQPKRAAAVEPKAVHREFGLSDADADVLFDHFGDVQATGPGSEGLFFEDTRHLSQWVLTVAGVTVRRTPLIARGGAAEGTPPQLEQALELGDISGKPRKRRARTDYGFRRRAGDGGELVMKVRR